MDRTANSKILVSRIYGILNKFFTKNISQIIDSFLNMYIVVDKQYGIRSGNEKGLIYDKQLMCYLWEIESDLLFRGQGSSIYYYMYKYNKHAPKIIQIKYNNHEEYSYTRDTAGGYVLLQINELKFASPNIFKYIRHIITHTILKFAEHPDVIRYFDDPFTNTSHLKKICITNDYEILHGSVHIHACPKSSLIIIN